VLSHKTNLDFGAIYCDGASTVTAQASQYPFFKTALASGNAARPDWRLLLQCLVCDLLSALTSFHLNPLVFSPVKLFDGPDSATIFDPLAQRYRERYGCHCQRNRC
jgi:hypothetical protein